MDSLVKKCKQCVCSVAFPLWCLQLHKQEMGKEITVAGKQNRNLPHQRWKSTIPFTVVSANQAQKQSSRSSKQVDETADICFMIFTYCTVSTNKYILGRQRLKSPMKILHVARFNILIKMICRIIQFVHKFILIEIPALRDESARSRLSDAQGCLQLFPNAVIFHPCTSLKQSACSFVTEVYWFASLPCCVSCLSW